MNAARRKEIALIFDALTVLAERIDTVISEEQDYFDKMPEGIQAGEKGSNVEEQIANLTDAHSNIGEATDTLAMMMT